MGFMTKIGRPRTVRNLFYTFIASLSFNAFSGCSNSNQSTEPNNPPGNGGYAEDKGSTDDKGEIGLDVNNVKIDIKVFDSFGNGIKKVDVGGYELENGIYAFGARKVGFYSNAEFIDSWNGVRIYDESTPVEILLFPVEPNKPYMVFDKDVPDIPKRNLEYVTTTNLRSLGRVYQENERSLFTNTDVLEFFSEIPGVPDLTFVIESNKFRKNFVEDYAINGSEMLNRISRGGMDPDAYYLDVHIHKDSGILIHEPNQKYCTLKGNVKDENGFPIDRAFVELSGFNTYSDMTDNLGNYIILFLEQMSYPTKVVAEGFETLDTNLFIERPILNYASNRTNFVLREPKTLDTLIINLNEGTVEDATVYI